MDAEILDAVADWGTRRVSDGVSGLYELADESFSGAVTNGTAWAFVLNGRFVGVFDGTIEDFEDASLTAHTAPDLSLPLLYAMQARGGDVRGQYYSNDTPLSEIDDTLSTGSFVGYVELSENVLSGDYYVVYYGGRALPVAFVGNNRRLLSGDEAFERAADEVGIYSVVDADIEVVDLPERPEPKSEPDRSESVDDAVTIAPDADAETDAGSDTDADAGSDTDGSSPAVEDHVEPTSRAIDDADGTGTGTATAESQFSALDMTGDDADDADTAAASSSDTDDTATDAEDAAAADAEGAAATDAEDVASTDAEGVASTDAEGVETTDAEGVASTDAEDAAATDAEGVETTDAEGVASTDAEGVASTDAEGAASTDAEGAASTDAEDVEAATESVSDADPEVAAASVDDEPADDRDHLRQELDAARAAKAELEAERDRIAAERDDYREEVERLRERVSSLEAEIDRLDADAAPESTLDPDEALSGINLFVRYEDKSDGTLERAAQGRVSEAELRDNLRLDFHTEFESDGVQVDGRPFDAFLRDRPEYKFSVWLLTSLTYEIRQTDTRAELSKLYEAIEAVDRIDLDGAIDVTIEDAVGDTETTTVTFDVVFRDKMGGPLFAASFDDARDPTHAEAIQSLLDGARSVSDAVPSFAAAFVVTTSFFDADAMEVAVDATRGGLFSRSSRKSYVKLSRKSGFHLCLIEARDEDFFLTVPEL